MNEYDDIHDISLLLENLVAEGKSLFQSSLAVCFLLDEDNNPTFLVGQEGICQSLINLIDTLHESFSSVRTSYIPLSDTESPEIRRIFNDTEHQFSALLLFPLRSLYTHTGVLAFFINQAEPQEKLLGEGELLAHILGLSVQNSLLTDTVLNQSVEMGLFYETTAALSVQMDSPHMLETMLDKALQLLNGNFGCIYIPESRQGLSLKAHTESEGDSSETFLLIAERLARKVVGQSQTILIQPPDILPLLSEETSDSIRSVAEKTSGLAAPMDWGHERVGILVILTLSQDNIFSEHDLSQMRLIAFQAANALGVERLIEAEREQRRFAEALQSASVMISRQIHLDEVLDKILEQAMHAFHCDAANIMVIEGSKARIERSRGYDQLGLKKESIENFTLNIQEHLNLSRMSGGEAIYVQDITEDDSWILHPGFNWCKSWAGVPIVYSGALLGFLNLDSSVIRAFSTEVLDQLKAFATHAGIALHKAKLYERLTNEHFRLQQIYEVGRKIGTSLEPEHILEQLLDACFEVLGGVYGTIFSFNSKTGVISLELKKAADELGNLHELYLVELLAKRIAYIQEPDCDYIAYSDRSYWLLGFPLRAGDTILGIVMIWVPSDSEFEQAWLDALATLGQQAALSLVKAEKHLQLQRRLDELTILQHVSGTIARQLEFDAILKELTDQLHNKLGYHTSQVYIREGERLLLRQFSGPEPNTTSVLLSEGIIGRAARTGIPELVPDVSLAPHYIKALKDTVSELAVPISQNNEVIGIINVETSTPNVIDEGTKELLLLLADQVSIALQNAKLYKQIRDTVESLESRVKARTAVLEAVALQAQEAERAKVQFVADVSHELRTPLTNIGLYLDLLEFGPGDRYQEYFHTMRRETERLKGLIEQLLAISRLDAEQVELHMQDVQINSLLDTLVNDRIMMANKKGLDLIFDMQENLPEVQADPQYLIQVMTNILTNAMNYTPSGGKITILSRTQIMGKRKGVSFSIRDTGPGIPASEQSEIFNRFYRGSIGKSSGVSGTGLGLSISKDIISQHHGTIMLNSETGEGTTFTVWLPLETE
ncbi:MAG: GAF domain-containing protein [Anaerolineales bacterium]|nr:GAF domain-containing protein [Anaerolineales bacterium]